MLTKSMYNKSPQVMRASVLVFTAFYKPCSVPLYSCGFLLVRRR